MNCHKCKTELPPGAQSCFACGAWVDQAGTAGLPPVSRMFTRERAFEIRASIRRWTRWCIGLFCCGLLLNGLGAMGLQKEPPVLVLGLLLVPGSLSLMASYFLFAKLKGREPVWGLVGLTGCLGIILLIVLQRRCFVSRALNGRSAPACTKCTAPLTD